VDAAVSTAGSLPEQPANTVLSAPAPAAANKPRRLIDGIDAMAQPPC
jgi:hypothetical protein